MSAGEQ